MKTLHAVVNFFLLGLVTAEEALRATTIVEAPYVIKKGDKYEGYIPDLLDEISKIIKRKFKLQIVKDGKYGAYVDGSWNGMIREVMDEAADVAAAPITMSNQRSEVIEFTEHFMTFDTVVLMKKEPSMKRIRSAAELHNHTDIKCGVVKDGFTENFFKNSGQDIYLKMYDKMDKNQFPLTSANGVTQVRDGNGKFAFVIESSTADYWMNKDSCDLISFRLGSALPYHNYAFAVKKGKQDLHSQLNRAIRELKSRGEHDVLKAKWWPTECSASYRITYAIGSLVFGVLVALLTSLKPSSQL